MLRNDKPAVTNRPGGPRGNYSGGANQSKAYVRPSQTHPPASYVPLTPRQRGLTTTVNLTQDERAELNALRQDKRQLTFGPGNSSAAAAGHPKLLGLQTQLFSFH
jgi:hypothetical protein